MTNPPGTAAASGAAADPRDALRELTQRSGASWRVFVLEDVRVMFVQINKNACTSLKWMIAGIAGEDLSAFGPSLEAGTGRDDDIHDRRQWKKVPRLSEVDPELWAQIHPDNGWFVFSVTRDPRARLFSAWQSKLLLNNPGYYRYRNEPWYPRHPADTESIVEDFAAFVDLFEREPTHSLRRDGHFLDQVEMLHEDLGVTYSEIYDIRELGRLQSDLRAHLDRVGWSGDIVLPRTNDTPLRPNRHPFADGIRERIEKLYAPDFARFGDRWDWNVIENAAEWQPEGLATVDETAEFGLRLGFVRNTAQGFRAQRNTARERAVALTARLQAAQAGTETARARAQAAQSQLEKQKARADDLKKRLQQAKKPLPWREHLAADLRRAGKGLRRRVRTAADRRTGSSDR